MQSRNAVIWTAAVASLLLAATPASAAKASKQESVGMGSGAIIGAVAGGPLGFLVGAAIGAKIGDDIHEKSEQISELEDDLVGANSQLDRLETDIVDLSDEVDRLHGDARPELVALMQAGIDMDLLFRTDEFALTDTTGDRLAQLAATIAAMPEIQVQLDGFADERGDATYNHELSERRVEFVRGLFVAAGVHPMRIDAVAHGESTAQEPNTDSYALERRVSVRLYLDNAAVSGAEAVASNP